MNIVILAAGQGTRMRSRLPKVLHTLAGRPLLAHVLTTARALNPARIVVVIGHGADTVRHSLAADDLCWVVQSPQLGTGHALLQALPHLDMQQPTLVLYGDVPLTRAATLRSLWAAATDGDTTALALLTVALPDPQGYGRIVRDKDGKISRIVEEKDASAAERAIHEVNTGVLVAPTTWLAHWLPNLGNRNAQGEYYLTDIVALAVQEQCPVHSVTTALPWEVQGVNNPAQLAALERIHQHNQAGQLLEQGVRLADPARFDLRGELRCGRDVSIDVGCVFMGQVTLDDDVVIGAHCVIKDASIASGTHILPFSHIDGAQIGGAAQIGPYARLRPGTVLAQEAHVGNFVEIKNSTLGTGSKANHLAYVGDADVGARVNVGAGVITCNYDGANKHRTVIEDDVFIGSDSQLVAPVRVGRGATLGAGTTLTRDAPPEQLTVSRAPQKSLAGWERPKKHKEKR